MSAPSVATSTPVKLDPAAIKAEGHHVATHSEAKVDIHTVLSSPSRIEREKAATELVDLVKLEGPQAFTRLGLADAIEKGLNDKKNAVAREGACELISILVEQGVGNAVEPFFFEKVMKQIVSEAFADKVTPVRTAALDAVKNVVQTSTSWSVPNFLPLLLEQLKTAGKWQVKTGVLTILDQLVVCAPDQCARLMPDIIPVMVDAIWGAFTCFKSPSDHLN
jgi:elongation factor 3